MAQRVLYEGPAGGLTAHLVALGDKPVRLVALEDESVPKVRDAAFWEENDRKLREIMKGAPILQDRSLTAEDFYPPDQIGPDA